MKKCYGRQPDSGNPTVRDETGGLLKRELRYFWIEAIMRKQMSSHQNLMLRALQIYPNKSQARFCRGGIAMKHRVDFNFKTNFKE